MKFFRLARSISAHIFFALSSRSFLEAAVIRCLRWNLYAFKPHPSLTILLTDLTDMLCSFAIFCTLLRGFLWNLFFAIFTDLAVQADHFRPGIGKLDVLSISAKHFIALKTVFLQTLSCFITSLSHRPACFKRRFGCVLLFLT